MCGKCKEVGNPLQNHFGVFSNYISLLPTVVQSPPLYQEPPLHGEVSNVNGSESPTGKSLKTTTLSDGINRELRRMKKCGGEHLTYLRKCAPPTMLSFNKDNQHPFSLAMLYLIHWKLMFTVKRGK